MKNLQYARVGTIRHKDAYQQTANTQQSGSSFSAAFNAEEATLNNNQLNNISCK
ncbi:hypothetical protein CLV90_2846 [Maribacter spongiicola]|uniref:Uncharacterized protein n=1 Tax=Maribacter spongiicola TaxID=1206753 RepID=A0A4R7K1F2_9FLAO|nr:hypothetical protein [Maribacter spongiicola]TDT43723.1 hypothetical protein CLV90_2846 [Maribacter spongiicola]